MFLSVTYAFQNFKFPYSNSISISYFLLYGILYQSPFTEQKISLVSHPNNISKAPSIKIPFGVLQTQSVEAGKLVKSKLMVKTLSPKIITLKTLI